MAEGGLPGLRGDGTRGPFASVTSLPLVVLNLTLNGVETNLANPHARVNDDGELRGDLQRVLTVEARISEARSLVHLDEETTDARLPVQDRDVVVGPHFLGRVHQVADTWIENPALDGIDGVPSDLGFDLRIQPNKGPVTSSVGENIRTLCTP